MSVPALLRKKNIVATMLADNRLRSNAVIKNDQVATTRIPLTSHYGCQEASIVASPSIHDTVNPRHTPLFQSWRSSPHVISSQHVTIQVVQPSKTSNGESFPPRHVDLGFAPPLVKPTDQPLVLVIYPYETSGRRNVQPKPLVVEGEGLFERRQEPTRVSLTMRDRSRHRAMPADRCTPPTCVARIPSTRHHAYHQQRTD
jgi:hypothetical protein